MPRDATPWNDASSLYVPGTVELWEFDTSRLAGQPDGSPLYIQRFADDSRWKGESLILDGTPFTPWALRVRGFGTEAGKPPTRPTLSLANPGNAITKLMDQVGGDWGGAVLLRRAIAAKHLDDGDDPDSTRQYDPQVWVVSRVRQDTPAFVELELRAPTDVDIVIPRRVAEPWFCPWAYLSTECGWTNVGKLWYDRNGVAVGDIAEDDCGHRVSDCRIRHHAQDENPLRHGGVIGIGNTRT